MKTYDEIYQNVISATKAHQRKMRKIQQTVSISAVCTACVLGVTAFMKLQKPLNVPPDSQDVSRTIPTMTTDEMTKIIDTEATVQASSDVEEPASTISRVIEEISTAITTVPEGTNTSVVPADVIYSESEQEMTAPTQETAASESPASTQRQTETAAKTTPKETHTETTAKTTSKETHTETVPQTEKPVSERATEAETIMPTEPTQAVTERPQSPTEPTTERPYTRASTEIVLISEETCEETERAQSDVAGDTLPAEDYPESSELKVTECPTECATETEDTTESTETEEEFLPPDEWKERFGDQISISTELMLPELSQTTYTVTVRITDLYEFS